MERHCCFNTENIHVYSARIHVPLAEKCSMGCVYCGYINDKNICDSQHRPGVAINVLKRKEEIEDYLQKNFSKYEEADIIGVSGPGDPLENIEELDILINIMQEQWSNKKLCVCTNGRLFFPYGKKIVDSGILEYITFTINTLNASKVGKIYRYFNDRDIEESKKYIDNLLASIKYCKQKNVKVKVNTVFLPEINKDEIITMFHTLLNEGVDCFNLLPKRNLNDEYQGQTDEYLMFLKKLKSLNFPMTSQCKMCRSDFCGH